MYPVSEAYLEKIAGRSVTTNWYGSIKTTIGTVYTFDPSIIVEGSGKITRQICSSEDIEIGSTCAAELDISLYLPNVSRYELYKGTVTLFFQLKLNDQTWETVPVGIFSIAEPPERTMNVITIHAYDAMLNFNKDFGVTLIGNPYYLLNYACNACGVELGTTQEAIANYVNGTVETYTYEDLSIYTFRDLVGFVASYLCCYAYIGVDGKLYLDPYTMNPVRDIDESWRFEYKPKDYEAFYSAIRAFFAVTEESETITIGSGGLTYELGTNPLIQFNADDVRKSVLTNIITQLSSISYTPFTAKVPCDPSLMIGDVLNFVGNHAVDGKMAAITKQVITINGSMELVCAGSDPNLNVLTASEKQIASITRNSNKDGMYYYDYANAEDITIGDGESAQIILFNYITTKETHIDFHAEVKCMVDTTEGYDEATDTYTEEDGVIYVTYKSGGAIVTEYYPVDTFFDGLHLLHLVYTWWASGNINSEFEVTIRCVGCTVTIVQGAARGYIAGIGLVGDGAWDGSVRVNQNFSKIDFSLIRKPFYENISTATATPTEPDVAQNVLRRNFFSTIIKSFTENVGLRDLHQFDVLYNAGDMTYNNVVVQGNTWVVEDTGELGIITTPNCAVSRIVQITSKHSGYDVAYIVSFDGGSTWWTYANGWVEPDYTQDVYGMFEATMRSITQDQWAEKLNGTIMVQAILIENASLTDIEIFTAIVDSSATVEHGDAETYNPAYVEDGEDRIALVYDYEFVGSEQTVDEGRMIAVQMDTSIFSEIDDVEGVKTNA